MRGVTQVDEVSASGVVIETRNLSKRFKDVQAVDSLYMRVREGEIYGFLGPNGAGKTTTIKMIMGLVHPTRGNVLINGKRVDDGSVEHRRDIGYLPEQVAFYGNLTPVQTLRFLCELKGADKTVVRPLLDEVGLTHAIDRKVGTYSKGMVQLLGIAQAMIGKPSVYILDEPIGGLDARWVKVTREKIRRMNQEGATVLFSSHILSEVQALCDRVAIIDKGRLVAEDTVANLSSRLHIMPRLEIIIPGLGGKVPDPVLDIAGVETAEAEGDKLIVVCETEARLQVITALKEVGMDIRDFKTIEPALEDAFVKLISEGGD
ncbi:MAG: ATP-binding cassette domain-containing protein [Thermoplasmata archaeon]